MTTLPTRSQLRESLHLICKVIGQLPSFHLYDEHVAQRFTSSETEMSLRAITHNAALDSTLVNLRCFDEFFGTARRKDDIRAHDFPGVTMEPFLERNEALAIHQYLAHITVARRNIATHPWSIDEMVIRGLAHGVKFLTIVAVSLPNIDAAVRLEMAGVRDAARLMVSHIAMRT